jgi:drug/metabolite transporter (DMT)-like permease
MPILLLFTGIITAMYSSAYRTRLIPFLALLIALLAIGLAPIFVRFSLAEIGATATVFNRFWIATVIFGIWNGSRAMRSNQSDDENLPLASNQQYTLKNLSLLLLAGILFAAIQLLWSWSLTQTSVASSVTILHGLRPLLTTLGGWIVFKNRYDSRFLIGMSVAILGSILIGINDFADSIDKLQGDLLSALSATFSALELLIMERLLTQFRTDILLFWCCIISSATIFIVLTVTNNNLFPVSSQGWGSVIALALLSQVLGQGLITYSLNYLSSGVIAVTMLLDPIISALLAWVILSERVSLWSVISCCIVLIGIYFSLSSKHAVKDDLVDVINAEPLLD